MPSLSQRSASALAQLRSSTASRQQEVAEFLRGRAEQLNSRVLSALATRAAADPFAKVKKMIKERVTLYLGRRCCDLERPKGLIGGLTENGRPDWGSRLDYPG